MNLQQFLSAMQKPQQLNAIINNALNGGAVAAQQANVSPLAQQLAVPALAATNSNAALSVQHAHAEMHAEQLAADSGSQAMDSLGQAWDEYWDFSQPPLQSLSKTFGHVADAVGHGWDAATHTVEAGYNNYQSHNYALQAGYDAADAVKNVANVVSPNLNAATLRSLQQAATNNTMDALTDYNDRLDTKSAFGSHL